MDFKKNILIIGYGAVGRATLPILFKHLVLSPENITIVDPINKEEELHPWIQKGVKFVQLRITPDNINTILSDYLSSGDLLIDLSVNIDCLEIVQWCHNNKTFYINASVEVWDPYYSDETEFPYQKTLHYRHMRLAEMTKNWTAATTCIVDHGANPGLISHFAKKGLVDIAEKMISEGKTNNSDYIRQLIANSMFSELAMEIGIKVVHCSEQDTQISKIQKSSDEFVNTWSIEGFFEEAIAPAEIGWGTHESESPAHSYMPDIGLDNELILKQMGINTWIRSWIPNQEITGMVIRHGETFSISDRWTVYRDGKVVYRPTVCYVYRPCRDTITSVNEMRDKNYHLPASVRILNVNDIISGADILGALLMGHPFNSWWTGSILSIEEAEKLVPGQNATTIQVGIGLVAAIMWMIENPQEGLCLPDDLPYDYILDIARPYLGEFYSIPSEWTPLTTEICSHGQGSAMQTAENIYKFKNFISSYEEFNKN